MKAFLICWAILSFCRPVLAQSNMRDSPIKTAFDHSLAVTQADYYPNLIHKKARALRVNCDDHSCRGTGLPVTLVKFEGERMTDATVVLHWQTSEETNNDYFELQRTLNPRVGFTTVAKVKGAGTAASTQQYQYNDLNDYADYTYYRLKQVDFDGTYVYSSIISIKAGSTGLAVTAIPNPGQGQSISFKVSGVRGFEAFTYEIFDSRGTLVSSDKDPRTVSEGQFIKPEMTEIYPGKYSIRVTSNDRQATGSFVILP